MSNNKPKVDWMDLARQFEHDANVLGAFKRLTNRAERLAEAKAALALAPKDAADYALLVGDATDATLKMEQQVQHEIVALGDLALEWIPKLLTTVLAAYL